MKTVRDRIFESIIPVEAHMLQRIRDEVDIETINKFRKEVRDVAINEIQNEVRSGVKKCMDRTSNIV